MNHRPSFDCHRSAKSGRKPAGLDLVDGLTVEPTLKCYHLLPSVRGDLVVKLGRSGEARAEFERAVSLTRNARERELLLERARACAADSPPPQRLESNQER